jgi:4-amino-4-deoxy-L-arabinose transferase-like glycosyltransferase
MTTIEGPLGKQLPVGRRRPRAAQLPLASLSDVARTRFAFAAVVMVAGLLYTWNLTVSEYANTYYSAAAQAASQSWTAFFFGSLDAANFITIDKPPLATWLMGLSVRVFGLSSWSILLPEAVVGVATVAVLFATVRRTFGTAAATIAGFVMALTPAAVLIFRYNNPDALLTLLLVSAAWTLSRGLDAGRIRWAVAAGVLVGLAFLTKYLQAYLVLPALAAVWLVAAPVSFQRRLAGLVAAGLAVVVSSGWWVAIVELIPATDRPFIGGSTTNSALELLLGYDGLGRLFGMSGPGGGRGPGGGGGGFGGEAGVLRLFNDQFGGQIGWFIPFAIVGLVAGLWIHRHAARSDRRRAAYLLWGLWLAVHAAVFSFMSGIIHSYYAVALAPAIAALVGAGVVDLWRLRSKRTAAGIVLALGLVVSGWLSWQLLERTREFAPGLGLAAMAVATAAAVVVALPARAHRARLPAVALGIGLLALLAGPIAYAADTVSTAYSGGDPAAGPAVAGSGFGGANGLAPVGGSVFIGRNGFAPGLAPGIGGSTGAARPGGGAGPGENVSDALVDYLLANQGTATWLVAADSANQAAAIQLASGKPVMAMGGFSGSDPAPTLEQLQGYVRSGQLRFVIGGGGGPGGAGRLGSEVSKRATWLAQACSEVNVGGTTLYDCAGAA